MDKSLLLTEIKNNFSHKINSISEPYGLLTIEIEKEEIKALIVFLKTNLGFAFLTDICGIHYPENQGKELGVIYHLHNLESNIRVRLKTFFSMENAEVDTITDLFLGANWMERETFDFYGIRFKGHPDLRVILNDENLGYHPMLKQYRLEDETREDKDDSMFGR
ncbi:MAG: NADH-quinone oxidoreductase subunit C [Flavobacteriaceae bacterium]|nr:NADH-quinone oxidoreductase subunit C [Flavobacteriaceae bacterium]